AAYDKAIGLYPGFWELHNALAWLLATCPDKQLRDADRAVVAAKRAVQLHPGSAPELNTLGVAQFRAGDWNAAIYDLEKSMERGKGGDSFDWFFLAMTHWQRGEKKQARNWYDKGVEWMEKKAPQNEELRRFRAEATELLQLGKSIDNEREKK